MTRERCRCGHARRYHIEGIGCATDKCMNACWEYVPVVLPRSGERPVFGVHRLAPEEAWTPEPLAEYWNQDKRWRP